MWWELIKNKRYLLTGTCFVTCCLLKLLKWNYVPILQKNNKQHRIQNITVYSFYIELQYCVWEMHYFYRETLCLLFFCFLFFRNFSSAVLYWEKNWRNTTCPLWLFAGYDLFFVMNFNKGSPFICISQKCSLHQFSIWCAE